MKGFFSKMKVITQSILPRRLKHVNDLDQNINWHERKFGIVDSYIVVFVLCRPKSVMLYFLSLIVFVSSYSRSAVGTRSRAVISVVTRCKSSCMSRTFPRPIELKKLKLLLWSCSSFLAPRKVNIHYEEHIKIWLVVYLTFWTLFVFIRHVAWCWRIVTSRIM